MFARNRVALLVIVFFFLIALAGCGSGSSSTQFAPSATGTYTNANLSGMYAFSVSGTDQNGFVALAGSLQADGNGNITSGVMDINGVTGIATNVPVTGVYSVNADGRGLATLNAPGIGSVFDIDFVIVSSKRALAVRFDTTSSASGSFDKQDSTAFSAGALAGQYAFSVSGIGANSGTFQSAGLFTTDGVGALTGGLQDFNNGGAVTSASLTGGSYSVGSSNGRGTLSVTTTAGTFNFAFYIVDATHLKLIETDGVPVLAGDAFRQTGPFSNANVSGPLAFTVGGGLTGPFAAGGVINADGNGSITSGSADFNNGGAVAKSASTTGSYTISSSGRGTLTLTSMFGSSPETFTFAIYPSSGGLLMMELDSGLPSSGVAFVQQSGSISNASISGNYGYNLTGINLGNNGEVDAIAHLSANGNGQFTGAMDLNLTGCTTNNLLFSGSYSLPSNGSGSASMNSTGACAAGQQILGLYFVSNSRILVVELDNSLVSVGDIEAQQ